MFGAAGFVGAQVEFSRALFDVVDQRLYQRTLRSRPLSNFVDQRFAMLMEEFAGRKRRLLPLGNRKQIAQVSIRSKFGNGNFLATVLVIKLGRK